MQNNFNTPKEVLELTIATARKKCEESTSRQLLNGILGGIYVALASYGLVFAKNIFGSYPPFGSFFAAFMFPTALMMVVVCGGELFTGNSLMVALGLEEKGHWGRILKNWFWVWIGNLIGSVLIAGLAIGTGKFSSMGYFGETAIVTAYAKVSLSFIEGFSLGVLCNLLVAGAVWMATASKDVAGKVLSCFFPVMLFIFSGFEHSVANMYYLFSGFFATFDQAFTANILDIGAVNIFNIFIKNLLPVSLGNAVGGGILIAAIYWLIHSDKSKI